MLAPTVPYQSDVGDFYRLLKPRVMSLVVFTAFIGMWVAPNSQLNPVLAVASLLFIALGAGASGALNMWWDADIDAIMQRTKNRPIPAGRVSPGNALALGLWLSFLSVGMLGLTANWLAAGILAGTIFFYAVIYSMWLKRATPQNIVIGGAAGAFPPMIGWAVATGGVSVESVLMFALIFVWTPPHFWALALFSNADYKKAGIPMMPVVRGGDYTRWQILIYAVVLCPIALALAVSSIGGVVYFAVALSLSGWFVFRAVMVFLHKSGDTGGDAVAVDNKGDNKAELALFWFSIVYLFALFAALGVEAVLRDFGLVWQAWPVWI